MSRFNKLPSDEAANLLKATASADDVIRAKAISQFFDVIGVPIREAITDGDITGGIFSEFTLPPGVTPEFVLDPVRPGTENDYRAYTNPGIGTVPQRTAAGGKIILPTIDVMNSVDWPLKYSREARWDVVSRMMDVFVAGFVKKKNDDCWHTILKAAADRGMTIYDAAASAGQFTKRLFSMTKCAMARNGGGNAASTKRGRATNLWISCEAIQEILNWNVDQIPEAVRTQFYTMNTNDMVQMDVMGVKLHEMYELGVGQEYQDYYVNTLSASLVPDATNSGPAGHTTGDDEELGICLDLANRDSFVLANTMPLEIHEDPYLHRTQQAGVYGFAGWGVGVLDSRRVLACSF